MVISWLCRVEYVVIGYLVIRDDNDDNWVVYHLVGQLLDNCWTIVV